MLKGHKVTILAVTYQLIQLMIFVACRQERTVRSPSFSYAKPPNVACVARKVVGVAWGAIEDSYKIYVLA